MKKSTLPCATISGQNFSFDKFPHSKATSLLEPGRRRRQPCFGSRRGPLGTTYPTWSASPGPHLFHEVGDRCDLGRSHRVRGTAVNGDWAVSRFRPAGHAVTSGSTSCIQELPPRAKVVAQFCEPGSPSEKRCEADSAWVVTDRLRSVHVSHVSYLQMQVACPIDHISEGHR